MAVYIIELASKLGNKNNARAMAQYYVGYTADDRVAERLEEHRSGQGSKMLAAAAQRGIAFDLIVLLTGDRKLERQIKNRKETAKIVARLRAGKSAGLPTPIFVH